MSNARQCDRIDLKPLDEIGWLSGRNEEFLKWVRRNGRWIDVPAGQSLFHTGDQTDGMYGVGLGAVDLEFVGDGMDSFLRFRLEPGVWIGHGTLVPEMPRPFNVTVPIDSRLFKIPAPALRSLLEEKPHYWKEFYVLCIQQILGLLSTLHETQVLTPKARLARLILRLSEEKPEIEAGQDDLAALMGISKSGIRRALAELAEIGAIETRYRRVTVVDRSTLLSVATSS